MPTEANIKQKILAVFSVLFLFTLVSTLLWLVSLNNKKKTEILNNKVIQLQVEKENVEMLDKILLKESSTSTPEIKIEAKSFLTMAVTDKGNKKIINQKNPDQILPIASITKLMVAVVILENIDIETQVTAAPGYVGQEESAYVLEIGKTYIVKELLANALISSDNDSARMLGSVLGEKNLVARMNRKARELGLTNTHYVNVTGLDPQDLSIGANSSTVSDLANLMIYIKNRHPEILRITSKLQYNFCDIDNYCKFVFNTDKLLENKDFRYKIIGGKTGTTDLALRNLILMLDLQEDIFLINVVLGSEDNFKDTTSLINKILIKN